MHLNLAYPLVLHEYQTNFYSVTSPSFPDFKTEVTGTYLAEALDRARYALCRHIAYTKERGGVIPAKQKAGYVVYGDGMAPSDQHILWSKRDLMRSFGISRATVDRRARDGTFLRKKVGGRVFFDPSQVKRAVGIG